MNIKKLFSFCYIVIVPYYIYAQVNPLLSTTWNQGCYYNANCPTTGTGGACGRVWTGCNATSIAQIFKYYNYPASGMGNHCNTNNITHCVDFSAQTYNYTIIPNNVTSPNTEVAKLMYHLGIALDMQWSGTSSNSFFAVQPIKKYFKYSPRMYSTATFMFNTTQDLIDAIKTELNAGRPVYAKGGSHFYLIDGYNLSNQFHMNFGWGGTYDGYYNITSVVNGAGNFTPTNFIFNIMPMQGDLETANDTIVISANASSGNTIEFTSLQNWTMTTNASWISLNLSSGNGDYYNFSNGATFNNLVNNGPVRYGYIYINNGNDIDTIVIKQEASPLTTTPGNLNYDEMGGTQNITINYYSFGNWTAVTPDLWISLTPASGTGNGTIAVTCGPNPGSNPRNGMVIINAGVFSDTVLVEQDADTSTSINEESTKNGLYLYPNPANNFILLKNENAMSAVIEIYTINGQLIKTVSSLGNNISIETDNLENGIYILTFTTQNKSIKTKFTILR